MQSTIEFIHQELTGIYAEHEIRSLQRITLEKITGLTFHEQVLNKSGSLSPDQRNKIRQLVQRLKNHEPIQYLFGETEFFGLKFNVNPSVLIPRQETEELVDWILKSDLKPNSSLLDIGTGSGCIAIALKFNKLDLKVTAVDISADAVDTARNNAAMHGLEIDFHVDNVLNVKANTGAQFDVLVSNPPYVRESEKKIMPRNVTNFEPGNALFVPDQDPLIFYRGIVLYAETRLSPGGYVFLEINEELAAETMDLLKIDFINLELKRDINGKYRMIRARKR